MTNDSHDRESDGRGGDSTSTEPEGTIPDTHDGVGATTTEEPSSFEPEEGPDKDGDSK